MVPSPKPQVEQHPMVAVPDAIRIVLETTGRMLLERPTAEQHDIISSYAKASELVGRILAEDVLMSEPGYPPYRASIMDGYAIQSKDCRAAADNETEWTHQVSGRRHAGLSSSNAPVHHDTKLASAVYVTTGARIPDSYDCVVPIELVQELSDQTKIKISEMATIEHGKWIRDVGCDIPAGSVVLPRQFCLHPISLGLVQQSGQPQVKLVKPIRVGVLSTGNELLISSDTWANQQTTSSTANNNMLLQTGQIPDVNKPILMSLLASFGNCEPIDLGMERDDNKDSMTSTIQNALEKCDILLTTGGISMGETDIVEDVLVQGLGGTLHFGRLKMKPGKPTTFVTIPSPASKHTCLVFALPGNPVSAIVCTHLVVRPALNMLVQFRGEELPQDIGDGTQSALHQMLRNTWVQPEILATLTHDIKLDMERPEYHRVILETTSSPGSGLNHMVSSTGVQRSSRLLSLRDAQGLLVLPRGTAQQPTALKGNTYPVLLLESHHQPIRLKDSSHLQPLGAGKSRPPTKVAIMQMSQDSSKYPLLSTTNISERVQKALSGGRSGSVMVVSCQEVTGPPDNIVKDFLKTTSRPGHKSSVVDLWVVACSGSFSYSLEVSQVLRTSVGKVADAVALQARRGAAAQDGTAALFEPVVGYISHEGPEDACMLIALPTSGLDGGLDNVRGLLKHALNVARGKPHNDHHKPGHSH